MELALIAAVASNGVIGKEGKIPWHIPEDIKHFRDLTIGHTVIMGRNTFDSLPVKYKPLPGRRNIVVSRDSNFSYDKVIVATSIEDSLFLASQKTPIFDSNISYCIGGENLYRQMIEFSSRLEITRVYQDYVGDTFFPAINDKEWNLVQQIDCASFSFLTYKRKINKTLSLF